MIGRVTGPHITRYELRLAPGTKVVEGRAAQGRPRLRAGRDRHPDPGADPRQAGGRRRGPQRAPADRPPRRRVPGAAAGLVAADGVARQGHRRPRDRRRPGEDAAPAGRRHDRRRASRRASTRCCRASCCARRRTRCGWCWSTPSRSSSTTTSAIPHLLTPVITSPRMAANALQNLVKEMEQRYGTMSLARTRSLPELNRAREKRGEPPLPYILCVIDELADLMMVAPGRRRGLDHPPGAEGARGRHPPGARDAVAAGRRDHRDDQGQRAVADRVRGLQRRPIRA